MSASQDDREDQPSMTRPSKRVSSRSFRPVSDLLVRIGDAMVAVLLSPISAISARRLRAVRPIEGLLLRCMEDERIAGPAIDAAIGALRRGHYYRGGLEKGSVALLPYRGPRGTATDAPVIVLGTALHPGCLGRGVDPAAIALAVLRGRRLDASRSLAIDEALDAIARANALDPRWPNQGDATVMYAAASPWRRAGVGCVRWDAARHRIEPSHMERTILPTTTGGTPEPLLVAIHFEEIFDEVPRTRLLRIMPATGLAHLDPDGRLWDPPDPLETMRSLVDAMRILADPIGGVRVEEIVEEPSFSTQ